MDSRLSPISPTTIQIINPTKLFPMIKIGGSNSKVDRDCKFTKEGIVQSKNNRVLEIKSVEQIEKKGEGKLSDIAWVEDHVKYPFRVVMKREKNQLMVVFA